MTRDTNRHRWRNAEGGCEVAEIQLSATRPDLDQPTEPARHQRCGRTQELRPDVLEVRIGQPPSIVRTRRDRNNIESGRSVVEVHARRPADRLTGRNTPTSWQPSDSEHLSERSALLRTLEADLDQRSPSGGLCARSAQLNASTRAAPTVSPDDRPSGCDSCSRSGGRR